MKRSDWLNNSLPETKSGKQKTSGKASGKSKDFDLWERMPANEYESRRREAAEAAIAERQRIARIRNEAALARAEAAAAARARGPVGTMDAMQMTSDEWRTRYQQAMRDRITAQENHRYSIDAMQNAGGPFDREPRPTMRERQLSFEENEPQIMSLGEGLRRAADTVRRRTY